MALPEGSLNLQQVVRDLEKRVSELEKRPDAFVGPFGSTVTSTPSSVITVTSTPSTYTVTQEASDAVPVESTAALGAHE